MSIKLSMQQQFEIERFNRAIDGTNDCDTLKKMCKDLLKAWQLQKSASVWAMHNGRSGGPWASMNTVSQEISEA